VLIDYAVDLALDYGNAPLQVELSATDVALIFLVATVLNDQQYWVDWLTNSDAIQAYLASLLAKIDGVPPMPSQIPTGTIIAYGGANDPAPDGWYRCQGTVLNRADYADLFAVIGTTYNIGGESGTQFRLPDLRVTAPFGAGSDGVITIALGGYGGATKHTLSTAEIPAHSHTQRGNVAGVGSLTSVISQNANPNNITSVSTTANAGGGGAHNNMPPYVGVHYLIKT